MLYEMETVAMTEKQEGKMKVAELKVVRRALGVIRKDKIKNVEMARADFFEAQTAHGPEPLGQSPARQLMLKIKLGSPKAYSFYKPLIKLKGISKSVSGSLAAQ